MNTIVRNVGEGSDMLTFEYTLHISSARFASLSFVSSLFLCIMSSDISFFCIFLMFRLLSGVLVSIFVSLP